MIGHVTFNPLDLIFTRFPL